jgi:hypothetical protein
VDAAQNRLPTRVRWWGGALPLSDRLGRASWCVWDVESMARRHRRGRRHKTGRGWPSTGSVVQSTSCMRARFNPCHDFTSTPQQLVNYVSGNPVSLCTPDF